MEKKGQTVGQEAFLSFYKEVVLGFMQKCLSYQALFLIPVYVD